MLKIGEWNNLKVIKQKDFGIYLSDDEESGDVLLPVKQVPAGVSKGEYLKVFIYKDSRDRIIATVNEPYITMGQIKLLACKSLSSIGAFMDWGLEKDILLPFREQTCRVEEGKEYLVKMYLDKSERLCVSMKIYNSLSTDSPYKEGDTVEGIIHEYNPELGAFVAVDEKYSGLIPKKEIHSRMQPGDRISGRVSKVREDGKLDITILKPINEQIDEDADLVMNVIRSYNGVLPFTDRADKEIIARELGLGKNAFKRAVGRLLKQGRIEITEKNIIEKE